MTVEIQRIVASLGALPIVVLTEYQEEVELCRLPLDIFLPKRAPRLAALRLATAAATLPLPRLRSGELFGDEEVDALEEDVDASEDLGEEDCL